MRILLSIILSVIVSVSAAAQSAGKQLKREKPDLEKIRLETLDSKSPYYYPRLMKEFQRNDTLMKTACSGRMPGSRFPSVWKGMPGFWHSAV